jgi:hypothetical protein
LAPALDLTEYVTRLSDRPDPVPDAIWNEAARHYDEKGLAALLIAIGVINVWNRFNAATRQIAGAWKSLSPLWGGQFWRQPPFPGGFVIWSYPSAARICLLNCTAPSTFGCPADAR